MKYKVWDSQLNQYAFDEKIFENKKEAVEQLVSFFSIECKGDLTSIRKELWVGNEFAELVIEEVGTMKSQCKICGMEFTYCIDDGDCPEHICLNNEVR